MSVSVDLYSVPLVCEAVPQIGCGCLAKPVLARLGVHPDVAEAWLHHRGDVIAIEWLRELEVVQQVDLLRAALGGDSHVVLVAATASPALLATFPNPSYWYQRETVDQLSQEEAHTIAARLVQRLSQARVPLPDGAALQCDLACALQEVLMADEAMPIEARLARLLVVARNTFQQHLGPNALPHLEAWLTPAALLPEDAG
ncbi:hypothetical protein [Rhodanobacter denitrificans]|uniref:hypothetical protein n=1 Tax=Rhodanobacter denitrificans TaxID=666685 RepID=UPI001F3A2414|nr:hypothetical protein [Rhodanobacter denitrificans]UJJ58358.1 hypothetical protein LRK55_17235 [Rhodanobacter denitrificans]